MINFTEKSGAILFNVKVVPRASRSEIVGELSGAIKVRIASPPVDGAANAELVRLLSKTFGVSKSEIEILKGETSKNKQIKIYGISAEHFVKLLE